MSVMLKEEWQNVIGALKQSKFSVLQEFADEINSWFPFEKKAKSMSSFGTWKTIMHFQNKEGKRVDSKNKPICCTETLTFAVRKEENRISLAHLVVEKNAKNGEEKIVKYVTDKVLYLREDNDVQFGKLINNKGGELKTYNFQIKNNKAVKFREEKELDR